MAKVISQDLIDALREDIRRVNNPELYLTQQLQMQAVRALEEAREEIKDLRRGCAIANSTIQALTEDAQSILDEKNVLKRQLQEMKDLYCLYKPVIDSARALMDQAFEKACK